MALTDAFLLVFVVIVLAELGEKTMLATITLATPNGCPRRLRARQSRQS